MKVFSKGLIIVGLAVFSVASFGSVAHAAPWLGLFGDQTSDTTEQNDSSEQAHWYEAFKKKNDDKDPATSPDPQPLQPEPVSDDNDKDGLSAAQETEQGTSNAAVDTDKDGLSDLVESKWYIDKQVVFCGSTCALPSPIKKDIYLEADWMVKPDKASTKPTAQQVKLLTDAFAKEQISLHMDVGQFGGGNQTPYNAEIWFGATKGEVDFVDYKRGGDGIAPQFNAKRSAAWHYMLVGERYKRIKDGKVNTTSSGIANRGGPNLFIASALMLPQGRDVALAGTMMHELGHNLCLTHGKPTANNSCTFEGIDNNDTRNPNYPYKNYRSSMNYMHQYRLVDYAHNPNNAPGNHDDWNAINLNSFNMYSERANGQSPETATDDKAKNNILSNFEHEDHDDHDISVRIEL